MIIGPNRYDDGELLAPREDELRKRPGLAKQPTTDAGYCHRFMFASPTPQEQSAKVRRFFGMMANIPGYSTLSLREYEVQLPRLFGLDVVYTIETPFTGVR